MGPRTGTSRPSVRNLISFQWLFQLARSPLCRRFISWTVTHMSFVIPLKRLRETPNLVAFHHPQPSYPTHILLLPKSRLGSLMDISGADTNFLTDLFQAVQSIVAELNLQQAGYRLICNGGPFQEIPHLHFHLISGDLDG